MADTLNRWSGIGNLGRDPEIRTFQDGGKIANLSLGCTDTWKKDGQDQKRTFWAKVVLKGNRANVADHLKKGDRILIEGRLEERKWQDQSGQDRYSTEVIVDGFSGRVQFLTTRTEGSSQPSGQSNQSSQQSYAGYDSSLNQRRGWDEGGSSDLDDEIPF
ncbi:single-stranded DNA-binding protein [Acetobacter indonesiensis]|uniref:single-stranded DNA-binding protein n=1 Tax=Acetobacter indonesiensis TaxID=104101 RepID=UPI0039E79B09